MTCIKNLNLIIFIQFVYLIIKYTNIEEHYHFHLLYNHPNYFEDYIFLTYEETCPEHGLQYIESNLIEDEQLDKEGYCLHWSLFLLDLRIKNYKYDPQQIQKMLIENNNDPEVLRKFIRNYIMFIEKWKRIR